jgi:two-component system, NtrC family, sensor kinase
MEKIEQQIILVVDDNPLNLKLLCKFLNRAGLNTATAEDGLSALEQVKSVRPDLILLDVMMPDIDGFETCQRLKADESTRDIPVIFMTALTDTEHKLQAFQLGAVDYITKPFHKEEILARIHIHLELRSLTHKLAAQNSELQYSQHELEQRVEERTAELSQTLENLQKTQTQLVQSEKMSSLGQLVAGVAHEINNPVCFIHGNLTHASQYICNLLELVELYQKNFTEFPEEIQEKLEELDLEFIQEDLPKMLESMQFGTERIRDIVQSLRAFSRLDEAEQKPVDLHEGIDSTLILLGSRLQGEPDSPAIRVIKEYGNLPLIECYPGQINQVFMNILSNAIDTLEESATRLGKPKNYVPTIQIRTAVETSPGWLANGDEVSISRAIVQIADNGMGIPEEIQPRIFDPFFTTKPVGQGTGMGMSISYSIVVNRHQGRLTCNSVPGEGTEFAIEIPIQESSTCEPKDKPLQTLMSCQTRSSVEV